MGGDGGGSGGLWTLVVILRGPQGRVVLRFRSQDVAEGAVRHLIAGGDGSLPLTELRDECGAAFWVDRREVCGVLVSDMGKELAGNIEAALLNTKAQIRANEVADGDAVIQSARRRQAIRQQIELAPAVPGRSQ